MPRIFLVLLILLSPIYSGANDLKLWGFYYTFNSTDDKQPYGGYTSPEEAALNGCYFLGGKHEISCVSVEPCPYACAGYSIPGEYPYLANFINKDGLPAKMLVTVDRLKRVFSARPPGVDACRSATPNPILLPSGEKYLEEIDHVAGGPSSFNFSRLYLSSGVGAAGIGRNWTHNYHGKLTFTPAVEYGINTAVVDLGDGWSRSFVRPKTTWIAENSGDHLEQNANGWVLKDAENGIVYDFDGYGKLAKKTFPNNSIEIFEYSGGGKLLRVVGDLQRNVNFAWSGDYISSVEIRGAVVGFEYDSAGRLVLVRYPDGSTKIYKYERSDFPVALTGIFDENNIRLRTYKYDSLAGC